ncbi:origin of replication complex subunit 1-like isoform X2 [Tasmannia lanceolata]|uniref:origin of replication complex subunit 1-like isoform X2 n=1 Tax=Tasmannia lanceolata TaxID=3420 RepID=UPI00406392AE
MSKKTPKKLELSPSNPKPYSPLNPKPSPSHAPPTPETLAPRRSLRRISFISDPKTPLKSINDQIKDPTNIKTPKSTKNAKQFVPISKKTSFSPTSPDLGEPKKRKRSENGKKTPPKLTSRASRKVEFGKKGNSKPKNRIYYKRIVYDGGEFSIGDNVYVKRRENASSDEEDPDVEECRICAKSRKSVMIECDDCLGGFHLKCVKPPLKEVPEGDWVCVFCEARKMGKVVEPLMPPKGKKWRRTAREKLLSSDLWASHIESLWKEPDSTYWFKGRWYIVPEETAAGRQPHNLRRELYRTNDFDNIEMESVLRHCYVMNPKEFSKANNEGDDVFLCEYEYDVHWHSFKRLADIDYEENNGETDSDQDWDSSKDSGCDTEEDMEYEEESVMALSAGKSPGHKHQYHELAANSRKGQTFGLQKIGAKKIPEHIRSHKQTELERAKATLLLATLPKSLPCRNKEMEEITAFVKDAICEDRCLGRCLYIHGVPGTGKTMSVLSVMRNLRSEVDAGSIRPYCFVEINGLKLASPENIYRVIYEALSGHRVGWKKALQLLNERFSDGNKVGEEENQPCVLLIDELDLLVTRNQSVLYNILDWPTKPHSKLVVIGIANTMDLPEKLLPRISSRMGIQRLCFGPYNFQQLQEIISSRLKGIDAFEKQAIEFASRKVAAISGDARRALEICRRAAELADYRFKHSVQSMKATDSLFIGKQLVGMADVEAAIQEMFQAPHIQLAMAVSCLCKSNGEACPGWDTLLKVSCKLGECRIILCEEVARHRLQKLQLNFPSDDVAFALKDCPQLPWLAKYL